MTRGLKRPLLLAFGVLMAGLAAGIVWKASHKPVRSEVAAPHWSSAPAGPDKDVYQAIELSQNGKCPEALPVLDHRLKAAPDDWMALGLRSQCYETVGRLAEAISDLQPLVARYPADGALAVRLMRLLIKVGRKPEAQALAEKRVHDRPESAETYLVLSDFEADRDPQKSVRFMETYLELAWDGKATEGDTRDKVEEVGSGTYTQRTIAMFRAGLPETADRDAKAEIEARWYMTQKYTDFAPFDAVKDKPLGHVLRYLELAKAHGDPDGARYGRAKAMAAKFKQQVREAELPGSRPDAGAESPKR